MADISSTLANLDAERNAAIKAGPKPKRSKRGPKMARVPGLGAGMTPEGSDDQLALNFVAKAFPSYRWSPGLGWMVDNGVTWTQDDKLTRYDLAREVCRSAAAQADDEGEAKRIASARTVNAALSLAQSDGAIVIASDKWDSEPLHLNTQAGMADLRSGVLRPRGMEFVTQATRVWPKAGPCPAWERFLNDVFLGDMDLIEFMRRALGYCLTGDRREQVLFFWYGLGANGKSVLAEFIQWLMGTYAIKLPANVLMQSKGDRHPTELAQLRGKRLAISSELEEGAFFNEALVKELTGDTTMSARFMRQDFFEFTLMQKHIIIGNYKPRLRGGDPAMARRMLLVPFTASFKGARRDPLMLDKLKAEGPAVLDWMVQGAKAWATDGLAIPDAVRVASADYMADHDDLALWIDECCNRESESKAGDLYASFATWKKARGEHAPSMTAWGSRLTAVPGIEKRRSGGIRYSGIRLSYLEQERLNAERR